MEIRCEACNEQFNSKEEYDAHWKYILETPERQYNEAVKEMEKKLTDLIAKDKPKWHDKWHI